MEPLEDAERPARAGGIAGGACQYARQPRVDVAGKGGGVGGIGQGDVHGLDVIGAHHRAVLADQIEQIRQMETHLANGRAQPAWIRGRLVDAGDAKLPRARAIRRRHLDQRPDRDPLFLRHLPRHQHRRHVFRLGFQWGKAEKHGSKGQQQLAGPRTEDRRPKTVAWEHRENSIISTARMSLVTLHQFLFDRLWDRGVRHIYGIPGDFALNLFEALERDGRFTLVRLSHEPAVGFAADGAARMTGGLGVCCVTYGAGGLNMVNPVACAYAEESPLVVLSGGPGRIEKRAGLPVHHEVKSFESQLRVYAEVTEYSAILDDPRTAAAHIARALDVAVKLKRPVYLEIPRDMVDAPIDGPAPDAALELNTDEGAVAEAVAEITERLSAAERPVLIVGVEVHRFQLRDQVVRLAERMGVPVASSFLGRGVFPSRHLQFAGTYLGVVSPQPLRDIVENSDCVLLLGELISDTSLGVSAQRLDESNLIICVAREVFVGYHRYQDTPLERIVAGLLES